ncbi:MAG: FimV family protein [Gammaproteobacteria bacterium]
MRLKSAFFLLGLCYAGSAAGLGLGDLTVRSALGQPLHATIRILAPEAHTVDCFRVLPADGAVSAPLRAQLTLEPAGDDALLHLRSRQSVVDPILQFVLGFDCGPALRREYVILLDPPSLIEAPVVATPATAAPTAPPAVAPPNPAAAATPAAERPPRAPRSALPAAAPRPAAPRAETPAPDDSPRLVLSGRRMAGQRDAAFALKLDTNLLDLDRPPAPLTEVELSDENTALTRKLAHLESQLVELQQRNAELEARRASTPATPPPSAPAKPTWPLALLGLGLLLGLATLVVWLRRRSRPQAAAYTLQDDWTVPSAMPAYEAERPAPAQPAPLPVPPPPAPVRMAEIPQPVLEETTEVKDDILDQAEVYMAHGHSDLAIHLLQEHLREAPTESPVPWLLLLDLMHRDGDLAGYAATCKECRQHFNIALADHPAANQADTGEGLEAYPHLLDRLVDVWRAPDVDAFFNDLIYDHRGGTRMGFSPAAYREILLLRAIAQDVRAAA